MAQLFQRQPTKILRKSPKPPFVAALRGSFRTMNPPRGSDRVSSTGYCRFSKIPRRILSYGSKKVRTLQDGFYMVDLLPIPKPLTIYSESFVMIAVTRFS